MPFYRNASGFPPPILHVFCARVIFGYFIKGFTTAVFQNISALTILVLDLFPSEHYESDIN